MTIVTSSWTGQLIGGGRYRVGEPLGQGGMGSIFLAHDAKLGSQVVIKAIHAALATDPDFIDRFRLEIRSLGQLSHPNILKAFDAGEHEGVPFAVLQYLAGGSLRARQSRDAFGRPQPMPPKAMLGWLAPIAAALDYIHARGYIHRDIKPDNILLDEHDHVYLSDFGIAKVLRERETQFELAKTRHGQTIGTPHYMAPELIIAKQFDHRVDQYALAVTLYELVSGRYPFEGTNPTAIFLEQTQRPATSLDDWVDGLPSGVSDVVARGLAFDPDQRFESCEQLARSFAAALLSAGKAINLASRAPTSVPATVVSPVPTTLEPAPAPIAPTVVAAAAELDVPKTMRMPAPRGMSADGSPRSKSRRSSLVGVVALVLIAAGGTWLISAPLFKTRPGQAKVAAAEKTPREEKPIQAVVHGKAEPDQETILVAGPPTNVPSKVTIAAANAMIEKFRAGSGQVSPEQNALTNSLGMKLVWIPAGRFMMGSPAQELGRDPSETQRTHIVPRGFFMSATEVTQEEYVAVNPKNPSTFRGPFTLPVERVTWYEAKDFCKTLSALEKKTYRLPTEAEWEYACRGNGIATHLPNAPSVPNTPLSPYLANFGGNVKTTTPVGTYHPNSWGLLDMLGNVAEWCDDPAPVPASPNLRVVRGGCWSSPDRECRPAARELRDDNSASRGVGFRVVLVNDAE